ncbi:hypothetical protein OG909_25910 [Streptomyces sp. NBC_01754]|uniref:hypothetical protein n=1 Tax=Streptomyces sp. NBC_01754 TaxID=2975930 RepID=UPI002DD7E470|nr:hypothetical protein [Streptomyces sp. NBC_01754]WSC95446.1 hypothetical protein OG909_25910 [Streptomyces sp. NBC_01754]
MSHGVLALGVTAVCLAGNVWYLPACVDLRAGQDRPRSRRTAAAAVLTGWGSAALTALLLLTPVPLAGAAVVAAAGTAAVGCLGVVTWLWRSRERRETAAFTAAFGPARGPSPDRGRGPRRNPARKRTPADPAEDGR